MEEFDNLPPSLSASHMRRHSLPAPSQPPRGAAPEGGGSAPPASTPPFLQLIEMLHKQRSAAQSIPARALGGPVEAGKPYKVGERGAEVFVAQAGGGEIPLPEGFTLEPPKAQSLPEGFSLEPPAPKLPAPGAGTTPNEVAPLPIPAPMAGRSEWSSDEAEQAREVAAARLAQGAQPQGGRAEGAATRAIEGVVPAAGAELQRLGGIAKEAVQTGDLPPEQAIEVALSANPASVGYRTGMNIARSAATPAIERAAREAGVNIPSAALGGSATQATARATSAIPIGGAPLRKAAERADTELQAAGQAAAGRATATGEAVGQDVAGGHVRRGILEAGDSAPPKLRALARRSNEDTIGEIIRMAGSKSGADAATLAQLRRYVPREAQGDVQSSIIQRLGRGPDGEFNAQNWVRGYGNLSDRGKNILFGGESTALRSHLDAIEAVSRRAPSWQQYNRERSTLGTKMGTLAIFTGAYLAPMATLGAVVSTNVLARALSRSATAAPLAQWSRAYERVVRAKGAPNAMAAFTLATKNLNSNLGTDLTPDQLLKAATSDGGEE